MSDNEGEFIPPSNTIHCLNSKRQDFTVDVDWNMTVLDLKKKIEDIQKVSVNYQRVLRDLLPMENDKQLSEYEIKDGWHLNLIISSVTSAQPKKRPREPDQEEDEHPKSIRGSVGRSWDEIKVFITNLHGDSFCLHVKQTDTIDSIKDKIQDKIKVPVELIQLLMYDLELVGERQVQDYRVEQSDTMTLVVTEPEYELDVWIDLRRVVLMVRATDTLDDIKVRIQDTEGIPIEHQQFRRLVGILNDTSLTLAEHNIVGELAQVRLYDTRR